jgi:hypothetical protein
MYHLGTSYSHGESKIHRCVVLRVDDEEKGPGRVPRLPSSQSSVVGECSASLATIAQISSSFGLYTTDESFPFLAVTY